MERKLIEENLKYFDLIKGDLPQFRPVIQAVWDAYETLGLGDFDNDVWAELRDQGPESIISHYRSELTRDMAATGIRNSAMKSALLADTEKPIEQLRQALSKAKAFRPTIYREFNELLELGQISILDGEITISDQDAETIKEKHCRIYLDSDEAYRLYGIFESARHVYEELVAFNIESKKLWADGFSFSVFDSFVVDKHIEPRVSAGAIKGLIRQSKYNRDR